MRSEEQIRDRPTPAPRPSPASAPIDPRVFDWPTFGLAADIRPALAWAMEAGEPAALATLHGARGGAPFGVGAQMLFTAETVSGFLSGGCVEGDVAIHAAAVLADGFPRWLVYGDGGPFDIRLPCGSRIEVLVEHIPPGDPAAKRLSARPAERRPLIWVTDGEARACVAPADLRDAVDRLRAQDRPRVVQRAYAPAVRLVVVGSDPVALALLRLGKDMGFETVLIRPRGPNEPPAGAARYLRQDIPAAFEALACDAWTAVATMTHDPEQEHEALAEALRTTAFYVGALGSRRRIPQRNGRLADVGFHQDRIDAVRAPIGLATGAKSPFAIAVSIMAEIIASAPVAA